MTRKLFILGILLSIIIFLFRFSYIGFGVWGDGLGYYVYTRSLYFDHDIDFHNEYNHYKEARWFWLPTETKTGLIHNHWSVGPGVLWLPFMALGDGLAKLLVATGLPIQTDGYSPPYEIIVGIGNILYGYAGIYLLYKWLRNYFSQNISFISTLSIYLSTNLIFYISFEPNLSHGVSFFIVSLFLYLWQKIVRISPRPGLREILTYAALGLIGGLAAIIRHYDAILILVPAIPLFLEFIKGQKQNIKYLFIFLLFWFIGISPQLLSQQIIYGHFWYQPYLLEGKREALSLNNPHIWNTLFSLRRGLFFWSPILLLSLIGWSTCLKTPRGWQPLRHLRGGPLPAGRQGRGLLGWWSKQKKDREYQKLLLIFLLVFITQWQVIGHWNAALSAGYGARMYISSFPLFAFGLALFYQKLKSIKFISMILIIFTLWNFLLLTQFFVDKRLLEGQLSLGAIITGQVTSLYLLPSKIQETISR
ncbi:hypothetical protein HY407_04720 [Candidatus Gottesmanbacteria bacterium]|nr:hypothetical protein [Candidatus Gottesmanbacteria bacterium]